MKMIRINDENSFVVWANSVNGNETEQTILQDIFGRSFTSDLEKSFLALREHERLTVILAIFKNQGEETAYRFIRFYGTRKLTESYSDLVKKVENLTASLEAMTHTYLDMKKTADDLSIALTNKANECSRYKASHIKLGTLKNELTELLNYNTEK
jgi:hypothetical protein